MPKKNKKSKGTKIFDVDKFFEPYRTKPYKRNKTVSEDTYFRRGPGVDKPLRLACLGARQFRSL